MPVGHVLGLLAVLLPAGVARAGTAASGPPIRWPRWRGPNDNAVVETPLPVGWSPASNIAWRVALPGSGASTPIVWDGRIVVTVPIDGRDGALAFDADGREVWRAMLGPARPPKHRAASSCNPSPVTDGRHVWVYYKSGTLAALALDDGRVCWSVNVEERFGRDELVWDIGTSPVLTSEAVVLSVMNGPRSHLAAWDRESGRLLWSVRRSYPCAFEADQGYTTPLVFEWKGREVVLVWNAEHVTLHDARDGAVLWDCGGLNPERRPNWPPVASPLRIGGRLIVPYGRGTRLFGLELAGAGDVTATAHRWVRTDTGSYVPTPLAWRGQVVLLRDRHEVQGIDPEDGRTLWSGLLEQNRAPFYASPLIAADRLYAARDDGVVFVAELRPRFRVVARVPMGESIRATPVPFGSRLLLRGERTLWCVGRETTP
ncbi:MAG: PQQ-like beta-propeller repeat protein [Kiritimatiellae bacterium]|nr:PQQ-like beta-propeller repeat protein [Kiritimatiellia bacterium]